MAEEKKSKSITLHVAQRPFKLLIPESQEELYRKAEKRIQSFVQYIAEEHHISDSFAQLGYAVINFAVNEVDLAEKQQFVDKELKHNLRKIQEIVNLVLEDKKQ
jgi:predicted ATPase